jgi:hypothetical protein
MQVTKPVLKPDPVLAPVPAVGNQLELLLEKRNFGYVWLNWDGEIGPHVQHGRVWPSWLIEVLPGYSRNKIPLSLFLIASDRLHVWWHVHVPAITLYIFALE